LEDKRKTHAERTPNAQLTLSPDGSGYAITRSNLEGAETIRLKRVWERGQQVNIQELTGIIRIRDIFGNAPESGIIIYTTGPNLCRMVSSWLVA
jgi:hypothetical protein